MCYSAFSTGFSQACNIDEARALYDQLTPICPVLVALSASTPILRGHLVDTDHRWAMIVQSVDDRTKEERGLTVREISGFENGVHVDVFHDRCVLQPLKNDRFVIPKSRYDTIDSYLSKVGESFNDIEIIKDEAIYQQLLNAGEVPLFLLRSDDFKVL